jgi:hypothetical protein
LLIYGVGTFLVDSSIDGRQYLYVYKKAGQIDAQIRQGLNVDDLVERLVTRSHEGGSCIDIEEIDRVLGTLSEGSEGHPAPPSEVYTREDIYLEHN